MMGQDPHDSTYLAHMLEAIERIRRYIRRKRRARFLTETLLQDAVIRNIEIVGEAAGRLSPEFAARHPEIPWRDIVGMRHRLVHGYMKVNLSTVWEVVERDLPALEPALRALLEPPVRPAGKRRAKKTRVSRARPVRGRARVKRGR